MIFGPVTTTTTAAVAHPSMNMAAPVGAAAAAPETADVSQTVFAQQASIPLGGFALICAAPGDKMIAMTHVARSMCTKMIHTYIKLLIDDSGC